MRSACETLARLPEAGTRFVTVDCALVPGPEAESRAVAAVLWMAGEYGVSQQIALSYARITVRLSR